LTDLNVLNVPESPIRSNLMRKSYEALRAAILM